MPTHPQTASLDDERREILASVMGVLAGKPSDADEMAACSYLLKHLAQYGAVGRPRVESAMMNS